MVNSTRLGSVALSIALLASLGCRSTFNAPIDHWRSADVHVQQVRSLVVTNFRGSSGMDASKLVKPLIAQSQFYQLAPVSEFERQIRVNFNQGVEEVERAKLVEMAARMGIDAVLVGTAQSRIDMGQPFIGGNIRMGDPVVHVTLSYQLVESRTGRTLLRKQIHKSLEGEIRRFDPLAPKEEKIIARLLDQGVVEMASTICPHRRTTTTPLETVSFGKGATENRQGIRFARDNDWEGAIKQWILAHEANPECVAAVFNLGVAYEQRFDYRQARKYYELASQLDDDEKYREAFKRAAGAEMTYQVVQRQRARLQHTTPDRHPRPTSHPTNPTTTFVARGERTTGSIQPVGQQTLSSPSSATARQESYSQSRPPADFTQSRPVSYSQPPRPVSYSQPPRPVSYSQPPRPVGYSQPPRPVGYSQPPRPVGYSQPTPPVGYSQPPPSAGYSQPPRPVGYTQPGRESAWGQPPAR